MQLVADLHAKEAALEVAHCCAAECELEPDRHRGWHTAPRKRSSSATAFSTVCWVVELVTEGIKEIVVTLVIALVLVILVVYL
jgi:hypothetical protein